VWCARLSERRQCRCDVVLVYDYVVLTLSHSRMTVQNHLKLIEFEKVENHKEFRTVILLHTSYTIHPVTLRQNNNLPQTYRSVQFLAVFEYTPCDITTFSQSNASPVTGFWYLQAAAPFLWKTEMASLNWSPVPTLVNTIKLT
jgi:hypothetical protein